jgi:hypothetical protein
MDIRNIKEKAPEVFNGLYLEKIYELQKDLMKGYIGKIESDLPDYPINVNSKKGQVVLKDFSGRIVEEITEGYESTNYALDILNKVNFNVDLIKGHDWDMLLNHLQNSNEEQCDAFAFYVELLLYANVLPEDIYSYIETKWPKIKDLGYWEGNLQGVMNFGLAYKNYKIYDDSCDKYHCYNVMPSSKFKDDEEYNKFLSWIPGFRRINNDTHIQEALIAWQVTYHLGVSRNFLKNKPWKQTGVMTDEQKYQEEIVLGFIIYMGYLNYCGFTADTIYELFFKKHMVNVFRQKSKY